MSISTSHVCHYFLEKRIEHGGCYPEEHQWHNKTYSALDYVQKCLSCVKESECGALGFVLNNLAQYFTGSILMLVGFYMWLNKKFQKPPYPLLAWTLIMQSFFFFALCANQTPCYPGIYLLNLKSFGLLPTIKEWGLVEGLKRFNSPEWLTAPETIEGHILVYKAHYYFDYYQIVLS